MKSLHIPTQSPFWQMPQTEGFEFLLRKAQRRGNVFNYRDLEPVISVMSARWRQNHTIHDTVRRICGALVAAGVLVRVRNGAYRLKS